MVKNIVILGGGSSGGATASNLAKLIDPSKHSLTLINNRNFFVHVPATLRINIADEGGALEKEMYLPLDKFFSKTRKGKFIQGEAVRIDDSHVYLQDGQAVPYDALVLATGSTWRTVLQIPTTVEERAAQTDKWRAKFKRAKSIAIVGGGAVGLELAGEIKDVYPNTKVTVIHSQALPLNEAYTTKFRKTVQQRWEQVGVKFILADTVLDLPDDPSAEVIGPLRTANGKTISADLVVPMVGPRPNTSIVTTLDESVVTPAGFVKVLDTLQVPLASEKGNVFAVGDIIDSPEQKQAYKTGFHAPIAATNVISVVDGKKPKAKYTPPKELIVLTRGKTGGAAYLEVPLIGGVILPGFLVKTMKGKTLLTNYSKQTLGYSS